MAGKRSRLSLAYEGLSEMPQNILQTKASQLEELDLSHNKFTFLVDFPNVTTLVLDHNGLQSHVQLPNMPNLHTLWVNHNSIKNLSTFISTLTKSCPNLRFLSMMNNEAAPSYFNGGNYQQYLDYRYYVISRFLNMEAIDDQPVTQEQRQEAQRIYGRKNAQSRKKKSKSKKN